MRRLAVLLFSTACSAALQPPRAAPPCSGPVSCGREQLLEADRALSHGIQERGAAAAFAEVLLDDARLLLERDGVVSGKARALEALAPARPFTWTTARADVSGGAELGYSFGWTTEGHYAAVWRRQNGGWKLAVFLHKAAQAQDEAPPSWFVPFRGERENGPAPADTVAAVDTAFAALAKQSGTQEAFTAYAAQDAVQLARTMVFGREAIRRLLDGAPVIDWKPIASNSAQDLGYTVGAYSVGSSRGHYLTIWRLQTDGSWRFVVDGGVSA